MWNIAPFYPRVFQLATISGVIIFLFAFFAKMPSLYYVAILLELFVLLPKYYLNTISQKLKLKNNKQRIKLFINDEGHFLFEIENHSVLPIFSATLYFHIDDEYIKCPNHNKANGHYFFSFSLSPRTIQTFTVPIKGNARGHAKIKNVFIILNDPFNIQKMRLNLNEFYKTEAIVYPKTSVVHGLQDIETIKEGSYVKPYSLFMDMTAINGVREYMPGDPLKHIHWKATARMGELQTKTYERTIGMTWSIILMFQPSIYELTKREEIEALISRAAYICQTARAHDITIELFTNIKPPGSEKIFYLAADSTISHHAKLMELLAILQGNQIKSSIITTMSEIDRRLTHPRQLFFILPNQFKEDMGHFLQRWVRNGHTMYRVSESREVAYIKPLIKEGTLS